MEYLAKPADAGRRLDVVVADLYPDFTRSSLELLFDKDMVSVDGQAAKAAHKVRPKDKIVVDETYLKSEPLAADLPIIYEDDDVTVINKPAGVLTHSKGALNLEATVASFIKSKINDETLTGNRAGIVHRLDRDTSGLIITVKTAESLGKLQKQFSNRKVKKEYVAIVEGIPKPKKAIIDAPIMRRPSKPNTFKVGEQGKPALTEYKVAKIFKYKNRIYSLIELKPKTGRTHQLRVHMAYIGHPIVGDKVYGQENNGLMLHAKSLELTLPNGQ